jgi:uncharacterized membrane protein YdfJ with MMPL/SSD domain
MNHRLDAWEMGAAIVTLTLVVAAVWLPAVAVGTGIVGVFVGLGVGAWFWGTDSRDPSPGDTSAGDPFGSR